MSISVVSRPVFVVWEVQTKVSKLKTSVIDVGAQWIMSTSRPWLYIILSSQWAFPGSWVIASRERQSSFRGSSRIE